MDLISSPTGASPGEIPAATLHQFGILAGPLTLIPGLFSIVFYVRYQIDEARHAEIQRALEARRGEASQAPVE